MKIVNKVWKIFEVNWVVDEVLIIIHPINVGPLGVERDLSISISLNNSFESISVVVAPFALVPSESPLWNENWCSNDGVIHLSNSVGISSHHEVKISSTTNSVVGKSDLSVGSLSSLKPPILGSSKVSVNTEPGIIWSHTHVDWVSSIEVVAWWLGSLDWISSIERPK
jgi:hypothetical protein